jgi:hypothetical protein
MREVAVGHWFGERAATRPRRLCSREVLVALLLPLASPAALRAQLSIAEELRVNLHGGVLAQGGSTAAGPGFSIGYGTSRWFVPFITWDRVTLGDADGDFKQRHLDAGVRVHVRGGEARWVPVVVAAWTWRAASWDDRFFLGDTLDVKIAGTGPTLGAGVLYYVIPRVAVEATVKWTGGSMEQVTTTAGHFNAGDAAIEDDAVRINVGVSWFPLRARTERSP